MEHPHDIRVERIAYGINCPKDFRCFKSGFVMLCEAEDIGLDSFLKCSEEGCPECPFSMSFGYSYLCRCPVRVYIKKNLKK